MYKYGLSALITSAILGLFSPAHAQQRPPLFGTWQGGLQCDQGYRRLKLMMYGNGTGLMMIGRPSWDDSQDPDVGNATLQQPPEADVVTATQWRIGEIQAEVQLIGRLDAQGTFSGEIRGAPGCHQFVAPVDTDQWVEQDMRRALRYPEDFAQYAVQDMIHSDHLWTLHDVGELAALIGAYHFLCQPGDGGSGGSGRLPVPTLQQQGGSDDDAGAGVPSVQGNVQGNMPSDIQGNQFGGN